MGDANSCCTTIDRKLYIVCKTFSACIVNPNSYCLHYSNLTAVPWGAKKKVNCGTKEDKLPWIPKLNVNVRKLANQINKGSHELPSDFRSLLLTCHPQLHQTRASFQGPAHQAKKCVVNFRTPKLQEQNLLEKSRTVWPTLHNCRNLQFTLCNRPQVFRQFVVQTQVVLAREQTSYSFQVKGMTGFGT